MEPHTAHERIQTRRKSPDSGHLNLGMISTMLSGDSCLPSKWPSANGSSCLAAPVPSNTRKALEFVDSPLFSDQPFGIHPDSRVGAPH